MNTGATCVFMEGIGLAKLSIPTCVIFLFGNPTPHPLHHPRYLPPPWWLDSFLQHSGLKMRLFDAPSAAITLYSLSRLNVEPPRAWLHDCLTHLRTLLAEAQAGEETGVGLSVSSDKGKAGGSQQQQTQRAEEGACTSERQQQQQQRQGQAKGDDGVSTQQQCLSYHQQGALSSHGLVQVLYVVAKLRDNPSVVSVCAGVDQSGPDFP
jgi:hypothetical protein